MAFDRKSLWTYSHSAAIFFAVLLFTASFLCALLWTNGIVATATSAASVGTNTFTQFSPAVSTFNITYGVAIFGTVWNSVLYVVLAILEQDILPLPTVRLRYEIEKAACIVSVVGNAIYSVALIALMSTLARLAADAGQKGPSYSVTDRAAGQGTTAAMAGLAAASAVWACVMDSLHAQDSQYRRVVKDDPLDRPGDKQA